MSLELLWICGCVYCEVWRVGVWVGVSCALSLRRTKHGVEGVGSRRGRWRGQLRCGRHVRERAMGGLLAVISC